MKRILGLAIAVMAVLISLAGCRNPVASLDSSSVSAKALTSNQTGTNNGFYYQFWSAGTGSASMNLGSAGNYSVNWSGVGDIVCGKGWQGVGAHNVGYNAGVYSNSGGGSLALYGWTRSPLIEYYVCESWNQVTYNATLMGSFTSDGSTYNVYKHQQVNQPSIDGNNSTFWQYISVRQSQRTAGTITLQNHFNAWKNYGMNLGTSNVYQVMATESWNGSGQSNVTVWDAGNGSSSPSPSTSPTPTPSGKVYMTFDDGPSNSYSQTLISTLQNAGCDAASMFVIGQNIASNQSGWNAYKTAGVSVQNHSQTHQHMTGWTYQQVYNDLNACNNAITNGGKAKPTKVRLPYLESNSTILSAVSACGLSVVAPTVDSQDWNGASTSSIISALNNLQAGGNPLMHESSANTRAALPTIINNIKNRGLGFAQY
jgi:peptidoglycan/xylan/chitin deacetylase (PgdA/CDA1 family)